MSATTFVVLLCLVAFASAAPRDTRFNRFAPLDPVCLQPPISRVPTNKICTPHRFSIMYYYDSRTRDCERISYNGCGGSGNLFTSEHACEFRCDRDNSFESFERFSDEKK
uniref:BPTI/Kunitz inhibitor domain-containing protein n=1 Tax=Daphnia galeata TaxID=27404 RepID=A0A8J2RVV4_9CRUS|nr:unnamed protein product [Daphnia galeata]